MQRNSKHLTTIEMLYVVLLISGSLVGSKIIQLGSDKSAIYIPASIFCFAFISFLSNLILCVASKEEASLNVRRGILSQLVATVIFVLVGFLPAEDATHQEAYMRILGTNWVLVAASIAAFAISQFAQLKVFAGLRRRIKLRWANIISIIFAQLLDTIIYTTIAFGLGQKYLSSPEGVAMLIHIVITQCIAKWIVSAILSFVFPAVVKKFDLQKT